MVQLTATPNLSLNYRIVQTNSVILSLYKKPSLYENHISQKNDKFEIFKYLTSIRSREFGVFNWVIDMIVIFGRIQFLDHLDQMKQSNPQIQFELQDLLLDRALEKRQWEMAKHLHRKYGLSNP